MDLLKRAGCVHVYSSVESGNDFIRNDVMKRNMSRDQIIKAFSLYREYDMTTGANYIIGVPQENEGTIWDSIRLNRVIKPSNCRANVFYPYKGTVLGDYCFKEGFNGYEYHKLI